MYIVDEYARRILIGNDINLMWIYDAWDNTMIESFNAYIIEDYISGY